MEIINKDDKKRFEYLCHQLFQEPLGKELVKHLETILKFIVADPRQSSNFAYFREGQNDIIRMLIFGDKSHIMNIRGENERRSPTTDGE